ncbi:hypothetical protein GA0074692_4409 [Micromonospora pallida]|uniref:Uncharacterized protein n=1 Tax=Micromonospora pallida TaxID=145854 RepID=A0A1C6T4U0_9ACTN|nr:hypothetical protein [Micromonospora pallida]SCL36659.1 hypothetical protein GA0074692_4409 [Micromonospora pallida]
MKPIRNHSRRLWAAVAVLGLGAALTAPTTALGAPTAGDDRHHQPKPNPQVIAKAAPDECFAGVGQPYPAGPPCASGQAKVNHGYLWGMTRAGDDIWFGSGANVNCLTSGRQLGSNEPVLNDDWVCEYQESQIVKTNPQLPGYLGDHRTPRLYTYDTEAKRLTEKTDLVIGSAKEHSDRLRSTTGIRAAGNFGGVALLGGPAIGKSINLFAFDTDTGAFLGSRNFPEFGNIRHFTVAEGALYGGVGVGANGSLRGHVLRWIGSKADPFNFQIVANLPAQAADIAVHDGRVVVSTWPGSDADLATAADEPAPPNKLASIWMSPVLAHGAPGLNPEDVDAWQQIWDVSTYEPDAVVAAGYGLGGMVSYGGYLYWGTMHVPLKATRQHLLAYPPASDEARQATIQNTQRSISIYRGKKLGERKQKIELLYGATELPAYDPAANGGAGAWAKVSTGQTPLYGSSGFGNPYLNYTWKMAVAGGRLYVGTMDWSYLAKELSQEAAAMAGLPVEAAARALSAPSLAATTADDDPALPEPVYGGDLMVFESTREPAKLVSDSGVGNYLNYGIRNMVTDGATLYLGTANPMNLRADPTDDVPEGGWELIRYDTRGHH